MLRRGIRSRRRALAPLGAGLLIGILAFPVAAQAQSFTLPKACAKYGASGSEGDDPVVLVVDNYTNYWITSFTLSLIAQTPVIQWGISISPFRGGLYGYNVFTTYTPFLTSDVLVTNPSNWQTYNVYLPQPGVSGGRETAIYDVFPIVIVDKSKSPIPYAFVDFIPDFVGSSPLTLQADGNGQINLFCVQQNFQGYNITVHDSSGKYLFDGSIPGTRSGFGNSAQGNAPVMSSPHPDAPK